MELLKLRPVKPAVSTKQKELQTAVFVLQAA